MSVFDISGNEIGYQLYDTPIITGELPFVLIESSTAYTALTKENASDGTLTFYDGKGKFTLPVTMKLQGSGSLAFAKKNLNITFYNDKGKKQKIIFNNWYPTNKIHLKANEFDYSMVRNSVGAKFTYKMMGKYLPTPARSYIDSFPVIMYYNNEYMGCHTVNLSQDGKTYGFKDKNEKNCTNLVYRCGDTTTLWTDNSYWEYRGDKDETTEMRQAFIGLHNFMIDYANFTKQSIETHFDKQTLVAYWTLADVMCAVDSLVNNWTLVTWDGQKWYHVWYDLDLVFGLGGIVDAHHLPSTYDIRNCEQYRNNGFWAKIAELYATDIKSMYSTFRKNGVDVNSIYDMLRNFQLTWGWQNINADREKWASDKRNNNEISRTWISERIDFLDEKYEYTEN